MVVALKPGTKCVGVGASLWYGLMRTLKTQEVSLREMRGIRHLKATIIAIGGNAAQILVPMIENILHFRAPIITHGNGPQVGKLLVSRPDLKFHECVELTQHEIGGEIKAELERQAAAIGREITVEIIPTRVIVDQNDPAFKNPTKPVGVFYSLEEVRTLGTATEIEDGYFVVKREGEANWHVKTCPGGDKPFRRVVASPKPVGIHPEDLEKIKAGIAKPKNIVVACGGGGVPGYIDKASGKFVPLAGVIDKDLASALLALLLKVREMIISTKNTVAHNFDNDKSPEQQDNKDYYVVRSALWHLKRGQFGVGSMGEKIEAMINVLRDGVNVAMITTPNANWINFQGGTIFTRGWDITGRMRNLGIKLGNIAEKWFGYRLLMPKEGLQRWLVK